MSGKYPSLSPYVYCADNPVRCVDPNGELFGDYFDQCGNYLGTDGIDDGNVYIILNKNKSWVLNNCSYQSDEYGVVFFDKYASNYKVDSKSVTKAQTTLIIEVKTTAGSLMVDDLSALDGVGMVTLMEHQGEVKN